MPVRRCPVDYARLTCCFASTGFAPHSLPSRFFVFPSVQCCVATGPSESDICRSLAVKPRYQRAISQWQQPLGIASCYERV